jgi:hypothetical protein
VQSMIHYQLRCDIDHAFDGWFKDSASFDHQAEAGLITCPLCSSVKVARALMAPAVARKGRRPSDIPMRSEAVPGPEHADQTGTMPAVAPPPLSAAVGPPMPDKLRSLLQHLRSEVEKHCDYVGPSFAEEARRIHYGESKARGIYGETTPTEADALAEEGIEFGVMPWLRRSDS